MFDTLLKAKVERSVRRLLCSAHMVPAGSMGTSMGVVENPRRPPYSKRGEDGQDQGLESLHARGFLANPRSENLELGGLTQAHSDLYTINLPGYGEVSKKCNVGLLTLSPAKLVYADWSYTRSPSQDSPSQYFSPGSGLLRNPFVHR